MQPCWTNEKIYCRNRQAHRVSLSQWHCLPSIGCCSNQLLSVVTLGSGLRAFPFSSDQIKRILCILGDFRWGISAKHIRSGCFRTFFTYTHKTIFQPTFSLWYAACCPMGPIRKPLGFLYSLRETEKADPLCVIPTSTSGFNAYTVKTL